MIAHTQFSLLAHDLSVKLLAHTHSSPAGWYSCIVSMWVTYLWAYFLLAQACPRMMQHLSSLLYRSRQKYSLSTPGFIAWNILLMLKKPMGCNFIMETAKTCRQPNSHCVNGSEILFVQILAPSLHPKVTGKTYETAESAFHTCIINSVWLIIKITANYCIKGNFWELSRILQFCGYSRKFSSVKFRSVASFGAAKASNLWKFFLWNCIFH